MIRQEHITWCKSYLGVLEVHKSGLCEKCFDLFFEEKENVISIPKLIEKEV